MANDPTGQGQDLVITRIIDAPRQRVWEAWTRQEHLVQWWGQPKDATMPFAKLDFRVGGFFHYKVELPEGRVVWGKKVYREITEPERLVFDDYYSDEQGNQVVTAESPHMVVTATFADREGKTELTVRHAGIGAGTGGTMDQYKQGWSECLDRLDQEAAKL
jgi:uncharacterized protein YndB with AHSA1/START domain